MRSVSPLRVLNGAKITLARSDEKGCGGQFHPHGTGSIRPGSGGNKSELQRF